ncbi:putative selenium delivery protein YdfZ [Leclercia pneumoniae]|uniref:Selenium delivery protein YdfZ n=1 Tax=Leclercia pneumoniae TaxID=2815358 RepID=A0ABX8K688_9ENTR|nr:putative selenium delivery protein YdfZ [Leclercia pneumoniae]QSW37532.1 putative selenium delivery protein YdfZ [Leclercia pneumoniae]QWW81727.1 putative selenium delivery protein YdfZ [Leclercia pneumoniae]
MMTYDRNRNAISTGSRVMINSTGTTGTIRAIHSEGLSAAQVRRNKTVEVEGVEGRFEPVELIRLGLH